MYPVNYKPSVSARLQFTQLIISPAVIISLTPYTLPYISPDPHLSSSMLWCFCMCAHAGNLWLYQAHALRCPLVCMCVWKGGGPWKISTDTNAPCAWTIEFTQWQSHPPQPIGEERSPRPATSSNKSQSTRCWQSKASPPFRRSNAEEMLSLINRRGSMAPNGGHSAAQQNINKAFGSMELSGACVNSRYSYLGVMHVLKTVCKTAFGVIQSLCS